MSKTNDPPKTVLELLATGKQWTQSSSARDIYNNPCRSEESWATKWCLIGAIERVYGANFRKESKVRNKLANLIFEKTDYGSIAQFNDDLSTTFRKVKALVREADI